MPKKYIRKTSNIAMSWAFRQMSFWERVKALTEIKESGCHEFTGNKDECGYGRIQKGEGRKGLIRVHRAVMEKKLGWLPVGAVVMHICDNPGCINPEHLKLGTQIENIADMDKKNRRRTLIGTQQSQAKLKESDIPTIRSRLEVGDKQAKIAMDYGVSDAAIANVHNGRTWTHVK